MDVNNKDIVIYTRVSSKQTKNFNDNDCIFISNSVQQKNCKDYLDNLGINNFKIIDENVPSFSGEMSKQKILFDLLKINGSHLVFYRVDRMTRDANKGIEIINTIVPQNDITLHFVNEKIIYNKDSNDVIKDNLIEYINKAHKESKIISNRLKDHFNHMKEQGHELGVPKYGFKIIRDNENIRKKVENESEKSLKDFILKLYDISEFNNDIPISSRLINTELKKLAENYDDLTFDKKETINTLTLNPLRIENSDTLTIGYDKTDLAWILNEYDFCNRNKKWTESMIQNIIKNERKEKRKRFEDFCKNDDNNEFNNSNKKQKKVNENYSMTKFIDNLRKIQTKKKKIILSKDCNNNISDIIIEKVNNDLNNLNFN